MSGYSLKNADTWMKLDRFSLEKEQKTEASGSPPNPSGKDPYEAIQLLARSAREESARADLEKQQLLIQAKSTEERITHQLLTLKTKLIQTQEEREETVSSLRKESEHLREELQRVKLSASSKIKELTEAAESTKQVHQQLQSRFEALALDLKNQEKVALLHQFNTTNFKAKLTEVEALKKRVSWLTDQYKKSTLSLSVAIQSSDQHHAQRDQLQAQRDQLQAQRDQLQTRTLQLEAQLHEQSELYKQEAVKGRAIIQRLTSNQKLFSRTNEQAHLRLKTAAQERVRLAHQLKETQLLLKKATDENSHLQKLRSKETDEATATTAAHFKREKELKMAQALANAKQDCFQQQKETLKKSLAEIESQLNQERTLSQTLKKELLKTIQTSPLRDLLRFKEVEITETIKKRLLIPEHSPGRAEVDEFVSFLFEQRDHLQKMLDSE